MDIKPLKTLNSNKDKKVSSLISIPLLSATILLITYLIVPHRGWWFAQKEVINSFFVNGAFFFILLVKSATQKPYSLELMHWIFCYFFFYFAATIQFRIYYFPWGLEPSNAEILTANRYLLVWGISFWVGTAFARYVRGVQGRTATGIKYAAIKDFAIIAAFATLYIIFVEGDTLFNRNKVVGSLAKDMEQSTSLLIFNGLRAFITYNVVFNILHYSKEKKGQLYLIFSVLCLLLACFPAGLSRFQMAAIYIGIMIFFLPQLRQGTKFTYVFIFGLIVLFPFMETFRYQDFFKVNIIRAFENVFKDMSYSYTEGHYDAFSMMIYTMKTVAGNGIRWGIQLFGNLLFFVPRRFWSDKPYGTGYTIMQELGRDFKNVSAPMPAEMYINFGFIGIILGGVLVGWVVKKIDMAYWQLEANRQTKGGEKRSWSYLSIFYPVLLSLFFFMLRGDFLSTLSYMMAFAVVGYIMFRMGGIFKEDAKDETESVDDK